MNGDSDQDCFIIPFDQPQPSPTPEHLWTADSETDLTYGPTLRYDAYLTTWERLHLRVQDLVEKLYSTLAGELLQFIEKTYEEASHNLPFLEIPAAIISGGNASMYSDIYQHVCQSIVPQRGQPNIFVTHLHGKECTSITNTLRSLIMGFISVSQDLDTGDLTNSRSKTKRMTGTVLANHDLYLLEAWHTAMEEEIGFPVKLMVLFHDVESFPSNVLEDLFHICSLHLQRLPFVFVLGLSTSPDYLRLTLKRSALKSVGSERFQAVGGEGHFGEIVEGLFFDLEFQPDIMLNRESFDVLLDTFRSHSAPVDGLISTLQLMTMEHFFHPLSAYNIEGNVDPEVVRLKGAHKPIFRALRLGCAQTADVFQPEDTSLKRDVLKAIVSDDNLIMHDFVDILRYHFHEHAQKFRTAFGLLRKVHMIVNAPPRGDQLDQFAEFARSVLDQTSCAVWIKSITKKISKLNLEQMQRVLQEAHSYFQSDAMPSIMRNREHDFCIQIVIMVNELREEAEVAVDAEPELARTTGNVDLSNLEDISAFSRGAIVTSQHSEKITKLFGDYFEQRLRSFETLPLHQIWLACSSTESLTDLMNPSIRSSLAAALIHPYDYLQCDCAEKREESISGFPDESVAFLRYLQAGKMLNVYDWFESFAMGLEGEPRPNTNRTVTPNVTPQKRKGKGKDSNADASKDEDDDERWKSEIQARFLRCFHELDMLGFLKQTGRKPEHAIRTVFEIID